MNQEALPVCWHLDKKVRQKSRECHNHKPQPFPGPKRNRKPTNLNKHKPNKRTKSTKISSLFPKRGNRNTKRTEEHKNKMTHGKTYNKSPRRNNHKATKSKTNTGTTALERSVEQTTGGFKALLQLANFTLGPDATLNTEIHKKSVRIKAPNSDNASKRKHKNQINNKQRRCLVSSRKEFECITSGYPLRDYEVFLWFHDECTLRSTHTWNRQSMHTSNVSNYFGAFECTHFSLSLSWFNKKWHIYWWRLSVYLTHATLANPGAVCW